MQKQTGPAYLCVCAMCMCTCPAGKKSFVHFSLLSAIWHQVNAASSEPSQKHLEWGRQECNKYKNSAASHFSRVQFSSISWVSQDCFVRKYHLLKRMIHLRHSNRRSSPWVHCSPAAPVSSPVLDLCDFHAAGESPALCNSQCMSQAARGYRGQ